MTSFLVLALIGAPPTDLRLHATAKPVVLNALEVRTEGGKVTTLGTRFEFAVGNNLEASLKTGPFTSQGHTFGHPKVRNFELTPQATLRRDGLARPPFLLSVPLSAHSVKAGETWTGVIVGPTPMPAGVKATFKAVGPGRVAGVPCLRVQVSFNTELGGAQITGGGMSNVRLDDGVVQTGSLNALLVYHRPNPVTRKMEESARVSVKATISR